MDTGLGDALADSKDSGAEQGFDLPNREFRRVPSFNSSRADTLASFDRIEIIVKNTKARFVIQHDPADFNSLPKFPAYLD